MTAELVSVRSAIAEIPALAGCWSIETLQGLTNRNYKLSREGEAVVLRLPGSGSNDIVHRRHEAHNHAIAASLGLAPPLLHSEPSGLLVTRYLQGAVPLDAHSACQPSVIARVGELLARLHRSGAWFEGDRDPFDDLDRYVELTRAAADPELAQLRKAAEPVRIALAAATENRVPSHIDLARANILVDGKTMLLIDWEYSAMAEPCWDLGGFSAEAGLDPDAMAHLLESYGRRATSLERARLMLWRFALDLLAAAWARLRIMLAPSTDLEILLTERKARAAATVGDLDGLLRRLAD